MTRFNRLAGTALAAALFTPAALAANRYAAESYVIDAPVIDVNPMIEIVEVSTPHEVCWNEPVERYVDDGPRGPKTSTIVGTVIGAAIGNNIARGDDRRSARVAGALLGGAIGRDIGHANAPGRRVVSNERRCDIEHVTREEERISGYRVTYEHDGRTFVTRTRTDPGNTVRLRVSVAPIH